MRAGPATLALRGCGGKHPGSYRHLVGAGRPGTSSQPGRCGWYVAAALRRCCSAISSAAIPPPLTPPPGAPGAALHTQPTLLAMITTELSASPISLQWLAHVAAASLGTKVAALVPTVAGHPQQSSPISNTKFFMTREPIRDTAGMRGQIARPDTGSTGYV